MVLVVAVVSGGGSWRSCWAVLAQRPQPQPQTYLPHSFAMEKAKPIGACLPAEDDGAGGEKPGRLCRLPL